MKRSRKLSHIMGVDDAPFDRAHRGDVTIVGAVFAGPRLDGVLTSKVRRDGANAAGAIASMIERSRFVEHLQLVMLQGVALAGFNVVDVFRLHERLGLPLLVVARREPDMRAVREALETRVRGAARKWKIIEQLGPMEKVGSVWIQRVGLSREEAASAIEATSIHSSVPEPLRVAHMIAGGLATGESRGRV